MYIDLFNKIREINSSVRKQLWMDFEINQFDGNDLIVGGAISLSYSKYFITIIFEQVEFMQVRYMWNTNTERDFLKLADSLDHCNYNYFSQPDSKVFEFLSEDFGNMYIVATDIQFDFNTKAVNARRK